MSTTIDASSPSLHGERSRIDVLDVIRGIAILGIFFINIQIMVEPPGAGGQEGGAFKPDHGMGGVIGLLVEGTQRGMLQMLFGAGMLLLTAKGSRPDGPVAVADDYFRRNLWLLAIGLVHVFVVRWAFDVVHVYAIAALFLFPFRLLKPGTALLLGLSFALLTLAGVLPGFGASGGPDFGAGEVAAGTLARDRAVEMWLKAYEGAGLWYFVLESLCTMLVGVALFKWGITQGRRSTGFYGGLAVVAYAVGLAVRLVLRPGGEHGAPTGWSFDEVGRLAMTVGHVAAINLAWRTPVGRWVLAPFRAAGRTALSLYFMQSIIGLWALPSLPQLFGVPSPGRDHLEATAAAVAVVLLLTANVWLRAFRSGPVEWAWHRLIDLSRPSSFGMRREWGPASPMETSGAGSTA